MLRTVDVAVVGGGVVGCAIVEALTRYDVHVALLDRSLEVGDATSKANSAIVHTGFDAPPGSLEARLLAEARELWPGTIERLGLAYRPAGAVMVALDPSQLDALGNEVLEKAACNGVPVREVDSAWLRSEVPYVTGAALGGLYVPDEAVIDPFATVRRHAEAAIAAGSTVLLGRRVVAIEEAGDALELRTDDGGRVRATMVINAAGLWADEVAALVGDRSFSLTPRKGQIAVTHQAPWLDRIVLPVPTKLTKGILAAPTVFGGVLLGPTAEEIEDKGDTSTSAEGLARIMEGASRLVPALADAVTVRQYAGLRAVHAGGDYLIQPSASTPQLLHVAGIRSTGLSASPAIGRYVASIVAGTLGLGPALRPASAAGASSSGDATPRASPTLGDDDRVICLCRGVTRRAILAALDGPLPATTLDGLKRRTRALWGECQGNICLPRILELWTGARGVVLTEIQKGLPGSAAVVSTVASAPWPAEARAARRTRSISTGLGSPGAPYDVAFVGAGLSAMAALAAGFAGGSAVVLEYGERIGGCLLTGGPAAYGEEAEALWARFDLPEAVDLRLRTTALRLTPGSGTRPHALLVQGPNEPATSIHANLVLLACGGIETTRERAMIPGSRPSGICTPALVHGLLDRGWLPGRRAFVYGNGHPAVATATRLLEAGVQVTLGSRFPPMSTVPAGIEHLAGVAVLETLGRARLTALRVRQGSTIREVPADLLVYAIGQQANTGWLAGSGVALGPDGRVLVDGRCETSIPGVLAVGTIVSPDPDHRSSIRRGRMVATLGTG